MNGKTARALRKLLEVDLGKGSEQRNQGHVKTGTKYVGVISHDGNHDIREDDVFEARTHPDRHLYRKLKEKFLKDVDVRQEVKEDIKK